MEKSWEFLEIFGSDDIELCAPEPKLGIDDPLWDYQKSDGSSAELCRQLEDADLVAKLIGSPVDIQRRAAAPAARGSSALNKLLADLATTFAKQAARPSAAKLPYSDTGGRWGSAKHQAAIRSIVNRARSADVFAPIKDSVLVDLWDRLVVSATDYVCASVHDAA